MKRLFWLLPFVLLFAGFRTTGYRSDNTIVGDMTLEDSTTLNKVVVQGKAAFEDDIETEGFIRNTRIQGVDSIPSDSVTGYCTFVFDDGNASHYDSVFPMFTDSSAVGVLAIITGAPAMGGTGWTRVKEMYNAGWEIASHATTNTNLTTITSDSVDKELRYSKNALAAQGIVAKSFVYPGGGNNELIRRLTAKYYNCARVTSGLANSIVNPPLSTFALPGWNFMHDSVTYRAYAQIDTAVIDKGWVIFMIHVITQSGDNVLNSDSVAKVLSYAQSEGLHIVTLQQGLQYMGNRIEVDDGKFVIGNDGSAVVNKIALNDTFTGDLVVNGDIKSDIFIVPILGDANNGANELIQINKNSSSRARFNISGMTFDSLVVDSVGICVYAQADSNTIDSVYIQKTMPYGVGPSGTILWGDGTDKTSTPAGSYRIVKYTGLSFTMSRLDRFTFCIYGLKMAANNDIQVGNGLIFGHPK